MIVRAPAKINLALDILNRDISGYHEIRTVFQEIPELYNEIEIIESDKPSDNPVVLLLQKKFGITKSAEINISRNIPFNSGLGGESSSHAAVLKALNELWSLNFSQQKLLKLAAEIGMDVPFFVIGGTALGTHFGEIIEPLPPLDIKFEIYPKSAPERDKTKNAYSNVDLAKCGKNINQSEKLVTAIRTGDYANIEKYLHNDFETPDSRPTGEHLSGAGPSTFKIQSAPEARD